MFVSESAPEAAATVTLSGSFLCSGAISLASWLLVPEDSTAQAEALIEADDATLAGTKLG